MRYIICLFLTLSFWAPARATPTESLSLTDRVIGVSATQVFILRETNDYLGLYVYGMRDIYLVAKNATTGEEDDIWPVYRVYAANTGADGTEETKGFPLEGAVNPYDILATGFESQNSFTPQEMLANPKFEPDDCSFDGAMTLYRDPAPKVVLANISCLIDDWLWISLAVVVPE